MFYYMQLNNFRNPDDPFVEIIHELSEITSSNSVEDDLFKDCSSPKFQKDESETLTPNSISISSTTSVFPFPSNNTNNTSGAKPAAVRTSKFGAIKVVKSVNFDEIEAKARNEREEADKRGTSIKNQNFFTSNSSLSSPNESFKTFSPVSTATAAIKSPKSEIESDKVKIQPISKEQQDTMDRLGMGMRKMNINQSVSSAGNATAASAKIKHQSISSEQFSSRTNTTEDSFVNDRLREIDTSKGISSDAFFGRSTINSPTNNNNSSFDDEEFYNSSTSSPNHKSASITSNSSNNYTNLTNSAKDLASKIAERASNIDIKGMKQSISSAGSRLSAYLQDFQNK